MPQADRLPVQLSGGEQQRLALAAAVVGRPALVVADEPTAQLDVSSAASVLSALTALRDLGASFVISSHDDQVIAVADRVLELRHGELVGVSMTVLSVDAVDKSYGVGRARVAALVDVNLELEAGELVALVGPSGSGKSSLLNILCGWETPDQGQVTWSGTPRPTASLAWSDLAIVPQALGLLDELSVRENVALPARFGTGGRLQLAISPEGLLKTFGLSRLAGRSPAETSLGRTATRPRSLVGPPARPSAGAGRRAVRPPGRPLGRSRLRRVAGRRRSTAPPASSPPTAPKPFPMPTG